MLGDTFENSEHSSHASMNHYNMSAVLDRENEGDSFCPTARTDSRMGNSQGPWTSNSGDDIMDIIHRNFLGEKAEDDRYYILYCDVSASVSVNYHVTAAVFCSSSQSSVILLDCSH